MRQLKHRSSLDAHARKMAHRIELAQARVEAIDEAIALVRPFVANAWNGWELLEQLKALKEK